MHKKILGEKLEKLYFNYKHKFSSKDPVWILHRFEDENEIELVGLITAAYAYGSVEQINRFIENLLKKTGNKPYEFTINFEKRKDKKFLKDLNYRFNSSADLVNMFDYLKKVIVEFQTLKKCFLREYDNNDENILCALEGFTGKLNRNIIQKNAGKYHYLFSNPVNGSACKRMNLFLRWMVRKDEIDLGLWSEVSPAKLIMPVDVHIARISRSLGLVKRRSIDLKFAVELTNYLKQFDADDPVKYDFALCHLGMEKKIF